MATAKQIEANRANSKKSTGPKTAEGKDQSSCNALKHGLTATRTLVGHEDPLEYHELRAALLRDYAPANTQELLLVDRIASASWRTLRSRQMEQSLANLSIEQFQAKRRHPHPRNAQTDTEALTLSMVEDDLWCLMHRYDTQISREFFSSVAALEKMQNDRRRRARQAKIDACEERRQASREQQASRKPQQNQGSPDPNWLPFEKTRTAGNSAGSEHLTEGCATLKAIKSASPNYAGTGERNDSSPNLPIPGSGPDCELLHS